MILGYYKYYDIIHDSYDIIVYYDIIWFLGYYIWFIGYCRILYDIILYLIYSRQYYILNYEDKFHLIWQRYKLKIMEIIIHLKVLSFDIIII